MIAKIREYPFRIQMNEALLERLSPIYPLLPLIKKDLAKRKAGYRGELQLDYHLTLISKEKNILILHDLRLEIDGRFFQLDTLILTPFAAIILEVKHISGTFTLDSRFNQAIRKLDNVEESFEHPVTQVERQKKQLMRWLTKMKIPSIPITTFVVMTNRSTVLNTLSPYENYKSVVRVEQIEERLFHFLHSQRKEYLPYKQLKKIAQVLVKNHTWHLTFPIEVYGISVEDIITGVQCPVCKGIPMVRKYGHWKCKNCDVQSKEAHLSALRDYFLLISHQITNRQARAFLHLKSRDTTLNILSSMNLPTTGNTNTKTYHLTPHTFQQTSHQSNSSTAKPIH